MFGYEAFSEFAFDEQEFSPLDTSAFEDFLALVTGRRCWLLEIDAFSLAVVDEQGGTFAGGSFGEIAFASGSSSVSGGSTSLYYSSEGFASQHADVPADTYYDSRLLGDIQVQRQVVGNSGIGGLTNVFAEARLNNADGGLDLLKRDYALDGRRARLLIGDPTQPRSSFGVYFTGVIEAIAIGQRDATFHFSDGTAKLRVPANPNVYAGTGGLEGGADLQGKPKPKCWGSVPNITPPLVDSVTLTYQVHDGQVQDVPKAYDRGVELNKVLGAPAPGEYQVVAGPAGSYIILGAQPAGTVTCDVLGDASGSGYIDRAPDLALRILVQQAGLFSTEIDPTTFANLNTLAPASTGIYAGTELRQVDEVVDELLAGIGAFGGFTRHGLFSVGLIAGPSGTPRATFTDADIISVEQTPLPGDLEPVIWRALVGYQRNYTVQNDLAEVVPADRRVFAAEQLRLAKVDDEAIRSRRLLAKEYTQLSGVYAEEADAIDEAQRLFDLWSVHRGPYVITTRLPAILVDLGDPIQVQHTRHGLANGKAARVIGHSIRGTSVDLTVIV